MENRKKQYQAPEINIVALEEANVIVTSPE